MARNEIGFAAVIWCAKCNKVVRVFQGCADFVRLGFVMVGWSVIEESDEL